MATVLSVYSVMLHPPYNQQRLHQKLIVWICTSVIVADPSALFFSPHSRE